MCYSHVFPVAICAPPVPMLLPWNKRFSLVFFRSKKARLVTVFCSQVLHSSLVASLVRVGHSLSTYVHVSVYLLRVGRSRSPSSATVAVCTVSLSTLRSGARGPSVCVAGRPPSERQYTTAAACLDFYSGYFSLWLVRHSLCAATVPAGDDPWGSLL